MDVKYSTYLFVCGLNMVGCSSSIAEKKSTTSLLAAGLCAGEDEAVEGVDCVGNGGNLSEANVSRVLADD